MAEKEFEELHGAIHREVKLFCISSKEGFHIGKIPLNPPFPKGDITDNYYLRISSKFKIPRDSHSKPVCLLFVRYILPSRN